jgi:hypothetical protein
MSTISKLDPMVRQARSRRREVVRTIQQMSRDLRTPAHDRVLMGAIAADLQSYRTAPGWRQEKRFAAVLKREAISQPIL